MSAPIPPPVSSSSSAVPSPVPNGIPLPSSSSSSFQEGRIPTVATTTLPSSSTASSSSSTAPTVTPASVQISHLTNMVSLLTDQLSQFEHQLHEAVEEALEWKNSSEEWETKYVDTHNMYRKQQDILRNNQEQLDSLRAQISTYEQGLRTVTDDYYRLQQQYNDSIEQKHVSDQRFLDTTITLTLLQNKVEELIQNQSLSLRHTETESKDTIVIPEPNPSEYFAVQINYDTLMKENIQLKQELDQLRNATIKSSNDDKNTGHLTKDGITKEIITLSPVNSPIPDTTYPSSSSSSSSSPSLSPLARITTTKLRIKKQLSKTSNNNNSSGSSRNASTNNNYINDDNTGKNKEEDYNTVDDDDNTSNISPMKGNTNNSSSNNLHRGSSTTSLLNSPIDSVGFFTPVGSPIDMGENEDKEENIMNGFTGRTVPSSVSPVANVPSESSFSSSVNPSLTKNTSDTSSVSISNTVSINNKSSKGILEASEIAMMQAELAASVFLLQRDTELIEHMRNSIMHETATPAPSSSSSYSTAESATGSHNILSIIQSTLDELNKGRTQMGLTARSFASSVPVPLPTLPSTVPTVFSSSSVVSPSAPAVDKELHDTLLNNNRTVPVVIPVSTSNASLSSSPVSVKSSHRLSPLASPSVPELTPLEQIRQSRKALDNRWNAIMGSYRSLQSSSSSLPSSYRTSLSSSSASLPNPKSLPTSSITTTATASTATHKSSFITALSTLSTGSNLRVPPLPVNPVSMLNNLSSGTNTATTTALDAASEPVPSSVRYTPTPTFSSRHPVEHAAALSKQMNKVVTNMEQWKLERQLKHSNPYTVLHPPPVHSSSYK